MTEMHKTRDLVATLRDALHQLAANLERTRDGVAAVASQAERLRDGVAALCDLHQREDTSIGIEMLVDAAVDFLEACRTLEAGLLDAQADADTLEAEMGDDERAPLPMRKEVPASTGWRGKIRSH